MKSNPPSTIEEFLAQQAHERAVSAAKSKFFMLGICLGSALVGAVLGLVIYRSGGMDTQKLAQCSAERDIFAVQLESQKRLNASQQVMIETMKPRIPQKYTLLFDSSTASSTAPVEIFNMLRPGLGTMLGKLSQTTQSPSGPAWFIPADVRPVFYGDVTHAEVVTIDNKNQVLARGFPISIQQVQANPSILEAR